jgi:hypothetical protein
MVVALMEGFLQGVIEIEEEEEEVSGKESR